MAMADDKSKRQMIWHDLHGHNPLDMGS